MQGEIKVAVGSVYLKVVDRLGKLLFLYNNKLCDKLTIQKKKEKIWRSTLEVEQVSYIIRDVKIQQSWILKSLLITTVKLRTSPEQFISRE